MSKEASPQTAERDERSVREPSLRPASPAKTRATKGEDGARDTAIRMAYVGVDWRVLRIAAAIALSLSIAFAFEWWPFHVLDAPHAFLEAMRWSRAPFRWPASVSDVLPGAFLAAVAGACVRPRLAPRFVRLQTLLVIGLTGAVFVISEGGRLLLVGGRPTLMSVVIKLSALLFGLYIGSVMMSDRLHGCEAR